jgi:hypothetical protein
MRLTIGKGLPPLRRGNGDLRSKMVAIRERRLPAERSGDFDPIGWDIANLCSAPLMRLCFPACAAEPTVVP